MAKVRQSAKALSRVAIFIKDFLAISRKEIVEPLRPKLHFPEQHTPSPMVELGVGIGLLGEHRAKSNYLTIKNHVSDFMNIPLASQCITTIVDQHLLPCDMDISNLCPTCASRKRKDFQQSHSFWWEKFGGASHSLSFPFI